MSGCDKSVLQCSCSDTVRCGCRQTAQVNHKEVFYFLLFVNSCWLTINVPVVYMAWDVMILMRATSITWAIGRRGPWKLILFGWQRAKRVRFSGPPPLPMARVMDLPTSNSLSPSAFGLGLGTDLIWINWVIFWRFWCSLLRAGGFSQLELLIICRRKIYCIFWRKNSLVEQIRFGSESGSSTSLDPD